MMNTIKVIPQVYSLPNGLGRSWGVIINGKPYCVFYDYFTLSLFLEKLEGELGYEIKN